MQKDRIIDEEFKQPVDGFILSMESHIDKVKSDVIKPESYHECSTVNNEGLDELFESVVRSGLKYQLSDYRHGMLKFVAVAKTLDEYTSGDKSPNMVKSRSLPNPN